MDFEKLLELNPLPKKQESIDLLPIVEETMNSVYPQVPDPELDYLFTNWGKKVPEEPFVDADQEKKSNQLEKRKKKLKKIEDLNDDQKDIVSKIESMSDESVSRLKNKGWQKWNDADWKNAKRRTKAKVMPKTPMLGGLAITNLSNLVVGEAVRDRSNAIMEMKILNTLYKSLMTIGQDVEKPESKQKILKKIEDITKKVCSELKVKIKSKKSFDEEGLMGVDFKVSIFNKEYAIHTHFVKEAKVFLMSLWDKEEFHLILMLCEGYLREDHYLIGTAKSRMKAWMETEHGSQSGEDNR